MFMSIFGFESLLEKIFSMTPNLSRLESRNSNFHEGAPPFHVAAFCGNLKVVKLFLKFGYKINQGYSLWGGALNAAIVGLWSRESNAARYGEVVRVLLEAGAKTSARTKGNNTALLQAIENSRMDIIPLLLHFGADINERGGSLDYTPLELVVCHTEAAQADMVKLLLQFGPNLNVRGGIHNHTPLETLVYSGVGRIVETVNLFLQKGVDNQGLQQTQWLEKAQLRELESELNRIGHGIFDDEVFQNIKTLLEREETRMLGDDSWKALLSYTKEALENRKRWIQRGAPLSIEKVQRVLVMLGDYRAKLLES